MRYLLALGTAALLGFAAYSYADSTLIVRPSEMKSGESKTITDDGRTITVTREGNSTNVKIDDAAKVDRLTITREGNHITIQHGDDGSARTLIIGPDKFPRPDTFTMPHEKVQTLFVCPKDGTTLRVPADKADQTFKCPVDGTTMEKKKVRGFQFYFDDHAFDWNS